jgi:hypothetical protein
MLVHVIAKNGHALQELGEIWNLLESPQRLRPVAIVGFSRLPHYVTFSHTYPIRHRSQFSASRPARHLLTSSHTNKLLTSMYGYQPLAPMA